jgi:hypothetical protein
MVKHIKILLAAVMVAACWVAASHFISDADAQVRVNRPMSTVNVSGYARTTARPCSGGTEGGITLPASDPACNRQGWLSN